MPVDRSEWLACVKAEAAQAPRAPLVHPAFAQHIRMVAAKMEHLTDGDAWATYRAQLETVIDELTTQIEVQRTASDDLFGDDLFRARLALADLRGQVKGLRIALQAPDVVAQVEAKVGGA